MANVPTEAGTLLLQNIIKSAYADLYSLLTGYDPVQKKRAKELIQQLDNLVLTYNEDVQAWVRVNVAGYYEMGMFDSIKGTFEAGMPVTFNTSLAKFHEEALNSISLETYQHIASGMEGLKKTATVLLSQETQKRILEELGSGIITGTNRREISRRIREHIEKEGIEALLDKGGKRWDLKSYTEMLARTKLTQAYTSGTVNQMVSNGYDLVEVSQHGTACHLCKPWEGQVLSVTGKTKGYKTLDQAREGLLFHPNCLLYGNKIKTSEGALPIGEIRNGSTVVNMSGISTEVICNVVRDYNGPIYVIGGNRVKVSGTPNHACLTQSGWRRFEDVWITDKLVKDRKNIRSRKINGFVLNPKNFEALFMQNNLLVDIFHSSVVIVTSTVNFDCNTANDKIAYISFDLSLERELNPFVFHPFEDDRFILVGISRESIGKFFSTLYPDIGPVCISSILNEMIGSFTSWNAKLFHNIFNRRGALESTHFSDLFSTHAFFVIDPTQKGLDISKLLKNLLFGCYIHAESIKKIKKKCKVYDIQTDGTYQLENGLISHNCRHRIVPYHEDFVKGTDVWDANKQKYVKFEELSTPNALNFKEIQKEHKKQVKEIGIEGVDGFLKNVENKNKLEKYVANLPNDTKLKKDMEKLKDWS